MGQSHLNGLVRAVWVLVGVLAAIAVAPSDLSAQASGREVRIENQTDRDLVICLSTRRGHCEQVERGTSVIFTYPTRGRDSFNVYVREDINAWTYDDCQSTHPFSTIRLVVRAVGSCAVDPLVERGPDGALPVELGESVFARWSDGKWYPGRVVGFDPQGRIRVDFLDGDSGRFVPANVRRDGLRKGSFVHLRRSGGPTRAQIVERYVDTMIVSFGRGRQEQAIELSEVVLNQPPEVTIEPVSGRRPQSLINICNRADERLYLALGIRTEHLRISTIGWRTFEVGECKVLNHTEIYHMYSSAEKQESIDLTQAPTGRVYFYAQNEATFSQFGQAVGFAPSAPIRQIPAEHARTKLCVMQLRNVSFHHMVDNNSAEFGEERYCTDINSRLVPFGEVQQSFAVARPNGRVLNLNLE